MSKTIRVPLSIMQLRDPKDLEAFPAINEHTDDELSWHLIYRVEGCWLQEFFGGHTFTAIRETLEGRILLAETSVTLIITSAVIIDIETFSRTDWADGIDLDVIDESLEEVDLIDEIEIVDLPKFFPPQPDRP